MERTNLRVGLAIIVAVGMMPYSGKYYDQETILFAINIFQEQYVPPVSTTVSNKFILDILEGSEYSENPCLPNPCLNGGNCRVIDGSPTCECRPGFDGDWCEISKSELLYCLTFFRIIEYKFN